MEDEEGSDSDDIRTQSREVLSGCSATGPSPSSIVKLEANQKARNKKQRQELYGKILLYKNSFGLFTFLNLDS